MRMKRATLRMRALLVALTATSCCCMLTAASGGTSNPTTTTSVISNLLRRGDQAPPTTTTTNAATTTTARERFQPTNNLNAGSVAPPENPTTTTTTTTTTIETKVPSISPSASPITTTTTILTSQPPAQKPASQQLAQQQQQQQPATTTSQFQYVRPVTSATLAPVTSAPACQHNNRTYALGQTWNDDCLQVCQCVMSDSAESGPPPLAISACKPRCPVYHDPPGDGCKLVRSKQDECCLEWSCELEAKFAPTSTSTGVSSGSTSTTVMQTERGELSMSTTEIRMPTTTSTTTTTTAAPATTAPQVAATTTPRPSSPSQTVATATSQQASPARRTSNQQQQVTLAVTTTLRPTTTIRRPTGAAAPGARGPKRIVAGGDPPARPSRPADMTRSVDGSLPVQPNSVEPQVPQVDPKLVDLCINIDGEGGQEVNSNWTVAECNKPCRCVFDDEPLDMYTDVARFASLNLRPGSRPTEVRCGLPDGCLARLPLEPSAECPRPQLRWPKARRLDQDSCACPEVVCERPPPPVASTTTTQSPQSTRIMHAPTTTTTTTTTTIGPPVVVVGGCKLPNGGRPMAPGETFNDECHSVCRCTAENELRCEQLNCPSEPPSDHLCLAWAPAEPNFRQNSTENKCCPEFVCRVPVATLDGGALNGTAADDAADGRLVVVDEPATTAAADPEAPESPPPRAESFKFCLFMGKQYAHDERLPEQIQGNPRDNQQSSGDSSDTCERVCTCLDGEIVCRPAPCPALGDSPPADLECPAELAYQLMEDCCPKWACPGTDDIQIQQVNSTAVAINVKLPESVDRQPGSLVLNYTHVPLANSGARNEEPPANARWVTRPTKTSNGTLSSLIKYTLTGLRPASRYWVRFAVRYGNGSHRSLGEPLERSVHSFIMPATDDLDELSTIGTALTATTTTTTSTTSSATQPQSQPSPPPTRTITPKSSTTRAPVSSATTTSAAASSTTTTTTTTTSTTTTRPNVPATAATTDDEALFSAKPAVGEAPPASTTGAPCAHDDNRIDGRASTNGVDIAPHQPWANYLHYHVNNAPIQKYAWHLLVAFSVMTILFTIVSYLYFKKSSRMIAPITSPYHHHHHAFHQQSAYDNPTFTTKLVSYNANQPRVLLVDESYQNLDNLAKQKNMEVDKSSPLHHNHHHKNSSNNNNSNNGNHTTTMIQHQNGRQHLI